MDEQGRTTVWWLWCCGPGVVALVLWPWCGAPGVVPLEYFHRVKEEL